MSNFQIIKNSWETLSNYFQGGVQNASKGLGYTIERIKELPSHMSSNPNLTMTIMGANAVSLLIIHLSENYLERIFHENLTEKFKDKKISYLVIKELLVGGAVLTFNIFLSKITKANFNPLTLAAITIATLAIHLFLNRFSMEKDGKNIDNLNKTPTPEETSGKGSSSPVNEKGKDIEIANLKNLLSAEQQKVKTEQTEKTQLNGQIRGLKEEILQLKKQNEQTITVLQEKVALAHSEFQNLQNQLTASEKNRKQVESQASTAKQSLTEAQGRFQQEKQGLNQQIETLKREKALLLQQKGQAEAKLQEVEDKKNECEEQNLQLLTIVEQFQALSKSSPLPRTPTKPALGKKETQTEEKKETQTEERELGRTPEEEPGQPPKVAPSPSHYGKRTEKNDDIDDET